MAVGTTEIELASFAVVDQEQGEGIALALADAGADLAILARTVRAVLASDGAY